MRARSIDRRRFLVGAGAAAAGVALATGTEWWRRAFAEPAPTRAGRYGPVATQPDSNGWYLPRGFTSRVIAFSGEPVDGTDYVWHPYPDGGATFAAPLGGWVYVSNSEVSTPGAGGVGVVLFDPDGKIADAYRILDGTRDNCAGGATPWMTWLSGEEFSEGQIWECDPLRPGQGVKRPALGTFSHEAAAVDPVGEAVYLTEDEEDGRLYRFVPDVYPDLAAGTLQAAHVTDAGHVTWIDVSADGPARGRATTGFDGGEGLVYNRGTIVFTTKGDDKVWALDPSTSRIEVLYDAHSHDDPPLAGVDNITSHPGTHDLYVAEDDDDLEIVVLTAPRPGRRGRGSRGREVAPFARVSGPASSELAGVAFDPAGGRLYVSSQRGTREAESGPGITFEIRGPFVPAREVPRGPGDASTSPAARAGQNGDPTGPPVD